MQERVFQADLIKEIKAIFPGAIVLKNDANYLQGFPDVTILYRKKWACLEVKGSSTAERQPNQDYYVDVTNQMSFGAFIFPENREEILDDLVSFFRARS